MTLWLFTTGNVSFYLLCDYGVYWLLHLVNTHMNVQVPLSAPPHLQLEVQGSGPMADMYRVS